MYGLWALNRYVATATTAAWMLSLLDYSKRFRARNYQR